MRVDVSSSIQRTYPAIEDVLWNVGVYSKQADWDIKLMGLHVQIRKHKASTSWGGWAFPHEDSSYYSTKRVHPAGRIDLSIGLMVPEIDIVRLFAHELRHIGQFHRGRKIHGYLTTEWMSESDVEPDCHEFEEYIVQKYDRIACKGYKRSQYLHRCCTKPNL